ncbi:roadblock/LC7 domain-containing protein, partial [Desulfobulbus sp. F1]|nr:roadblock/LC7 domain-containing protein [Desulfobulbus sp. F1]
MNYGVVSQEQLEKIDEILSEQLIKIGVDCVIIIDMAGNIITAKDNGTSKYDVYSFAALAAG